MLNTDHRIRYMAIITAFVMAITTGCSGDAGASATAVSSDDTAGSETVSAEEAPSGRFNKVAQSSDDPSANKIDDSGLNPLTASELNEGQYLITTESSSPGFQVSDTLLTVSGDEMSATLLMGNNTEWFMYPGTAEEAASDTEDHYIRPAQNEDGKQLYEISVEALDKAIVFASYNRPESMWYNRTLMFSSSDLPDEAFRKQKYRTVSSLGIDDGSYYVNVYLEGGAGDESVESPALLLLQEGTAAAMILWSFPDYDHMTVDGLKLDAEIADDRSSFIIPVTGFDFPMPVTAGSTTEGKTQETDYTLYFDSYSITVADPEGEAPYYGNMRIKETIRPEYAKGFTIDAFDNGIYRVNSGKSRYLLVPRMTPLPTGIPQSVEVIRTPVSRVYAEAPSARDFLSHLDQRSPAEIVDRKTFEEGKADLAAVNSVPDDASISVPVFIDLSDSEAEPEGKAEWIKIYGLLTGQYGRAVRYFDGFCKDRPE